MVCVMLNHLPWQHQHTLTYTHHTCTHTHTPLVEVMIRVHGPLLAVMFIPILAGRVDILTGGLWTKTYKYTTNTLQLTSIAHPHI